MDSLYSDRSVTLKRQRHGNSIVYTLAMHHGQENRLDPILCASIRSALDTVEGDISEAQRDAERAAAPTGLVLCSGLPKYFSLGLDLQSYYQAVSLNSGADANQLDLKEGALSYIDRTIDSTGNVTPNTQPPIRTVDSAQKAFERHYLLTIKRLMMLPMYTCAAIDGHVIAGGLVLALAADSRLMTGRERGGLAAMNEIHLPSSIPRAMARLVQARCSSSKVVNDVLLLGTRMDARGACDVGLVDEIVPGDMCVVAAAVEHVSHRGHPAGKAPFVGAIKAVLYADVVRLLSEHESFDHFALALSYRSKL